MKKVFFYIMAFCLPLSILAQKTSSTAKIEQQYKLLQLAKKYRDRDPIFDTYIQVLSEEKEKSSLEFLAEMIDSFLYADLLYFSTSVASRLGLDDWIEQVFLVPDDFTEKKYHILAIRHAHLPICHKFLQKNTPQKSYPLHWAALNSVQHNLNNLPQNQINQKDPFDFTPMHWSAIKENIPYAAWLINRKADINAKDDEELTPLHYIATIGSEKTLQFFLDHKANMEATDEDEETPLFYALYVNFPIAKALIERGANVNHRNDEDNTILHILAEGEVAINFDTVVDFLTYLLQKNIKINAVNDNKETPLHILCDTLCDSPKMFQLMQLFLQKGAKLTTKDNKKRTPLHNLMKNTYTSKKTLTLIAQYPFSVKDKDEDQRTPMHYVQTLAGAEFLIQHNAEIDARDEDKMTPLHHLAKKLPEEAVSIAQVMINHNANVNAQDKWGQSPLHYIPDHAFFSEETLFADNAKPKKIVMPFIKLLVDNGADINLQRYDSWWAKGKFTPLHVAAYQGEKEIAQYLLELGANPFIEANRKTAYDVALSSNHEDIAQLILQYQRR